MLKSNHVRNPTQLRKTIQPGTVLIILAGRFAGKRVVFLKQLESGLLLVTGPQSLNKVPIRRVNQVYTIATKTKVDVSGVDVSSITDDTFKAGEESAAARKSIQTTVDQKLLGSIRAVPHLDQYLQAPFSLQNHQLPHQMKF